MKNDKLSLSSLPATQIPSPEAPTIPGSPASWKQTVHPDSVSIPGAGAGVAETLELPSGGLAPVGQASPAR